MSRFDGEREENEVDTNAMMITLVAISFALFFCLVCVATSSRGVESIGANGERTLTGNPGVERTTDGKIVYRGEDDGENPKSEIKNNDSMEEEATQNTIVDLELT